jgi:hypothetical protein
MTAVVEQGDTITLAVSTVDALGAAADSADLQLTIRTVAGVDLSGFPLSAGIVHPGAGSYTYDWACPAGQAVATYQVLWFGNTDIPFATASPLDVRSPGGVYLNTLADIRAVTHLDHSTDTDDDADLVKFQAESRDLIHTLTGRYFLPIDAGTYTFDGQWDDPTSLRVPWGVRNITTLKIRGGGTGSAQTQLDPSTYAIRPSEMDRAPGEPGTVIQLSYPWSYTFALYGSDVIEVVGDFGYAAVPPTIQRIDRATILRAWRARASGMGESLGGDVASFISWAMTKEDRQLLEGVYAAGPKVR